MQNKFQDEEVASTLLAISIVAKSLAKKMMPSEKGENSEPVKENKERFDGCYCCHRYDD